MAYITVRTEKEMDFYDLVDMAWSGACATLKNIEEAGKEDELMDLLSEMFSEGATDTEINDFLWFDDDYIYSQLGIDPYGEHEEEEEGEDDD